MRHYVEVAKKEVAYIYLGALWMEQDSLKRGGIELGVMACIMYSPNSYNLNP